MAKKHEPKKLGLEDGAKYLLNQFGVRLAPPLEGLAYRFTIWLPVQAKGKPVFNAQHRAILYEILNQCFGGYSQSAMDTTPPWIGSWQPEGAHEAIEDRHILLVIYTLQDADAIACLQHLKWLLQQDHIAAQQVVLVERVPVHMVEALAIPSL